MSAVARVTHFGSLHRWCLQETVLPLATAAHTSAFQAKVCSFFSACCLQILRNNEAEHQPVC